jgi:hypothetical protein
LLASGILIPSKNGSPKENMQPPVKLPATHLGIHFLPATFVSVSGPLSCMSDPLRIV